MKKSRRMKSIESIVTRRGAWRNDANVCCIISAALPRLAARCTPRWLLARHAWLRIASRGVSFAYAAQRIWLPGCGAAVLQRSLNRAAAWLLRCIVRALA